MGHARRNSAATKPIYSNTQIFDVDGIADPASPMKHMLPPPDLFAGAMSDMASKIQTTSSSMTGTVFAPPACMVDISYVRA